LKAGDTVKSGTVKGVLIRIQQKTQDAIIRDEEGRVHIRLLAACELCEEVHVG
tara:strand:- start:172 stop:330 length:159 start_codon:yes stop_codon:yes gene_type:complete